MPDPTPTPPVHLEDQRAATEAVSERLWARWQAWQRELSLPERLNRAGRALMARERQP